MESYVLSIDKLVFHYRQKKKLSTKSNQSFAITGLNYILK